MYPVQQYCTFKNILEFLDEKIPLEYTQQPNAFVENIANKTTEEQQNMSIMEFVTENACAWTSDMYMELEKCKTVEIIFPQAPSINLKDLFVFLSEHDKKRFWVMVCMCVGRSSTELLEKRQMMLRESVQEFKNDLTTINVEMTEEDIVNFVSSNRDAIATRYIPRLTQQIQLEKMDYEPFWCHMQKIYNILNPYDQITFVPSSSHALVTNMVDTISGLFKGKDMESGNVDFGQLMGSILSPQIIGQVTSLIQGSDPKEIVQSLISIMPEMSSLMPQNMQK